MSTKVKTHSRHKINQDKLNPGFFGISFGLPDIDKAIEVGDRLFYKNADLSVALVDMAPYGSRYQYRAAHLLAAAKVGLAYGIPTIRPDGEVYDLHQKAKSDVPESDRLFRQGMVTKEAVFAAARRHNPRYVAAYGECSSITLGGEELPSLPHPRKWFPKPFVSMPKGFGTEAVWQAMHVKGVLVPWFRDEVRAALETGIAVRSPVAGHYAGVKGGTKALNRHVFVDMNHKEHVVMVPRHVLAHRNAGQSVRQGDEIAVLAGHVTGADQCKATELLVIRQAVVYIGKQACLPWEQFAVAATAEPSLFRLHAWDFADTMVGYDAGSNSVCMPISRPKGPVSTANVLDMRVVLAFGDIKQPEVEKPGLVVPPKVESVVPPKAKAEKVYVAILERIKELPAVVPTSVPAVERPSQRLDKPSPTYKAVKELSEAQKLAAKLKKLVS